VDHPILTIPALEPSRSAATTISTPIERWVGRVTAVAAGTILEALGEYQDRGLTPAIKKQTGEVFWQLYRIRQLLVPIWDFDQIARTEGIAMLQAADVAPGLAKIAIDATLETLHKTIRDNLN
jgi:hypothetical protein